MPPQVFNICHAHIARTWSIVVYYALAMSVTQPSSESEPPPLKKLKQSTLTFHTTTQLDSQSSTSSTSHTDLEDTSIPHPDACTAECSARASDEEGPTPFQPKDSSTIELTRRKQGQKNSLLFSNLVRYLSLDNTLYYESSSILCLLPLLCGEGLVFR